MANLELQGEQLRMRADDEAMRTEPAADGSLFEVCHPRRGTVHRR